MTRVIALFAAAAVLIGLAVGGFVAMRGGETPTPSPTAAAGQSPAGRRRSAGRSP